MTKSTVPSGSKPNTREDQDDTVYASRWDTDPVPKDSLPATGMPPRDTYQLVKDELAFDGTPAKNLATFVTTFMEPEVEKLIIDNAPKNLVDGDVYSMSRDIEQRCVNMIANLWNCPKTVRDSSTLEDEDAAIGVSTVGSSEALILAVLALKKSWQERRKAAGKSTDHPNLVMPSNVQICVEKAACYLDLEPKLVFCDHQHHCLQPKEAIKLVDENTVGVICILGSTYTGAYEDVSEMNDLLEELNQRTEWGVKIHVDAASGGFVAPFMAPDLVWDFRLPMVNSINVSGHKYGLVYPGLGWVIWRNKGCVPDGMVFHLDYLGKQQASLTLNFSKSANLVIAQYYMFLRLGVEGYKKIMENTYLNCQRFVQGLEDVGIFEVLSDIRPDRDSNAHFDDFDISRHLGYFGWVVPAYKMAKHADDITLLRVIGLIC
ncbi:hypothetical protein HDV03_002126 [Kappamyces sp. JEL0829]|nr:hypothetical protein HDV03_002126 [Kappamyces sp. JEL0829]